MLFDSLYLFAHNLFFFIPPPIVCANVIYQKSVCANNKTIVVERANAHRLITAAAVDSSRASSRAEHRIKTILFCRFGKLNASRRTYINTHIEECTRIHI